MKYKRLFDPGLASPLMPPPTEKAEVGDRRDGQVYVYNEAIILAVNVALATGRPLLVRGPSGGGKSSLACNVARVMGWRYYERVISSRTQAHDLLWEVDHLRRLQDAQGGQLRPGLDSYILPGVLWWAFDCESARQQVERLQGSSPDTGPVDPDLSGEKHACAVVLLDEIDKADPDVPNNLLVPLGSLQFQVEGRKKPVVTAQVPLVFLTTNGERDLPAAFLRRCVELKIEAADLERLVVIGKRHFPKAQLKLLQEIARLVIEEASGADPEAGPSAAEFLDTVRACEQLEISPDSPAWKDLVKVTIWKHGRTPRAAG